MKGCVFLIGGVCSSNAINGQRTSIALAYVIFFIKKKTIIIIIIIAVVIIWMVKKIKKKVITSLFFGEGVISNF